jgi:hypothetical protein
LVSTANVKDGKLAVKPAESLVDRAAHDWEGADDDPGPSKDERPPNDATVKSSLSQYLTPADPTEGTMDFFCAKCSDNGLPSEVWDPSLIFMCSHCGSPLYDDDYRPASISSQSVLCVVCGRAITEDTDAVVHERCSVCCVEACESPLDPQGFFLLNGEGFCSKHMPAKPPSCTTDDFAKETVASMQSNRLQCEECRRAVDLASGVEVLGQFWFHFECFRCVLCAKVIESNFTLTRDQKACCPQHTLAELSGFEASRFG